MDIAPETLDAFRAARRPLFITGAGVSADSGLPTYRGIGGLYDDRATDDGMPIETALSGAMLDARPEVTWKYLWQIGAACHGARPNRGHEVIAEIESRRPETWVLTQNVDGLHRAAGSSNLIEIHGRAADLYCLDCGERFEADELVAGYGEPVDLPPRCPACGGLVRPDVVLFGEVLPDAAVAALMAALPDRDLVVAIGTSAVFPYIIEPVVAARRAGVPTIEINPALTELSALFDHRIDGGAAEAMSRIWDAVYA